MTQARLEPFTPPLELGWREFLLVSLSNQPSKLPHEDQGENHVVPSFMLFIFLIEWHFDARFSPPDDVVCYEGSVFHILKQLVSWIQFIVTQFDPYSIWI